MSTPLQTLVAGALTNVRNPRVDKDVISAGMVRDLEIDANGHVSFSFVLGTDDPAGLVREVRQAVGAIDGVTDVTINVEQPHGSDAPPTPQRGPPKPAVREALGTVVAISSGKGGVGKSTIAANLAAALARSGKRVGVMDADVYGPNVPRLFGANDRPTAADGKILPLERYGVKLMSLGFLVERDTPAIWRGPIVHKVVGQFLGDVDWGELDYFLIDLPPGTGDAQLSLVELIKVRGSVIVTTPQELAAGDSLRGAKMFERVEVPVLGIVENMSYFACPKCGEHSDIFGEGGGQRLADELGVPLLARVPLQARMTALADEGQPVVIAEPDSPAGKALADLAEDFITYSS